MDLRGWNSSASKLHAFAFDVLRSAENDTSHSLSADPYHQEEMTLRPVCLYYIRNDFIYMFYAFVYFCAVHEEQLSRQSVE